LNVIQTGKDNRPHLIALDSPKNLYINGITLHNSPQYHIIIGNALNTTISNVVIKVNLIFNSSLAATFPLNTDGIDITGKDVYFRNLSIENYDDAVGIKPSNAQSLWSNCTENVLVEDSYVKYGVGKKI
jgi:polygalacturonase